MLVHLLGFRTVFCRFCQFAYNSLSSKLFCVNPQTYLWRVIILFHCNIVANHLQTSPFTNHYSEKYKLQRYHGPYIKYAGGWIRVFAGAMKYFRKILMGHHMFLRIFDAQNFLRVFLIILVTSFKMSWGSKHKMLKLAIKGIWKKTRFF